MTTGLDNSLPTRVTKLAGTFLAAALLLFPGARVYALGLGEVNVTSAINEPLSAEIELLNLEGLEESELIVSLGSAQDYELAGVRYNYFHTQLEFVPDFSNPSSPVVQVTSNQPVVEPYLNFVVQARWPSGRLLREYTVLLDLPAFSGEQVTSNSTSSAAPTSTQPQQSTTERTQPVNVTPSPSASAPSTPSGSYRVQFGDTLWDIAQRVADDIGVTHAQAMLALRDLNPEAFFDGNMNRIMSGSLLRIPSANEITVRDAAQARAQVASELGLDGVPLQSTDGANAAAASAAADDGGGQFRLAGAQNTPASATEGESESELTQLQSENAVLEEELDAVRLENADLQERLARLEEQIAVLERLVEVENTELAQAQSLGTEQQQTQPAPSVVVQQPAAPPQPTLMDRLMGWIQWIGIAVVGLLIAAYLVIKRRNETVTELDDFDASQDFAEGSDFDEDGDHHSAVYETEKDMNVAAAMALDSDAGDDEDEFALPEESSEQDVTGEPEETEDLVAVDEDEDTDFDDLDAFFNDLEGKSQEGGADEFDSDALIQDESGESASEEADLADLGEDADADRELLEDELDINSDGDQGLDFDLDDLGEEDAESEPEAGGVEVKVDDKQEADGNDLDFDPGDLHSSAQSDSEEKADLAASESGEDEDRGMDFDLGGGVEPDVDAQADDGANTDDEDDTGMDFDLGDLNLEADSSDGETFEEEEAADMMGGIEDMDLGVDADADADTEVRESDSPAEDMEDAEAPATEGEASFAGYDPADTSLEADTSGTDAELDVGEDGELDDTIFSQLGEDDLDDLLGPEGGVQEAEDDDLGIDLPSDDLEEDHTEVEDGIPDEKMDDEGDDDLSGLTAMLEEDDDLSPSGIGSEPGKEEADERRDESEEAPAKQPESESDDDSNHEGDDSETECATKLELAEAYIDMGDEEGAKALLQEVTKEGSEAQQTKAQDLLGKLS